MNDYQKSIKFHKTILDKFVNRQIQKYTKKKCNNCTRTLHRTRYYKFNNKCLCFCCAYDWRKYTLLNTYYFNKESYIDDYKRDIAFYLDILENYKFGINSCSNIFGDIYIKNEINIIDNLNFEKRFLYKYKNNLRLKTSKMFWTIFTLNRIYNTTNKYYLPTELIIEIIYNTMYWIPKINY